jgi:hypothetical protein
MSAMSTPKAENYERSQIEAQIAAIARNVIKKVEGAFPLRLHRAYVYGRLSATFLEAVQCEMVDEHQSLEETRRSLEETLLGMSPDKI